MNNLHEIEINFELLDSTNAVHVIKSLEEGGFLVEVNGQELEMNEETIKCAVESDEVKVTCEFEAKLDLLNATKELKKVSVEVNTDGSEEVDVYVHEVKDQGNCQKLKSLKRRHGAECAEASAVASVDASTRRFA